MTYVFKFTDEATATPAQHKDGFAAGIETYYSFLAKISDETPLKQAGPLLCAGATVFSPMSQRNIKKGSVIGVIGIGGLGHLATRFANK